MFFPPSKLDFQWLVHVSFFSNVLAAYASFLWDIDDSEDEDRAPNEPIQVFIFLGMILFRPSLRV